MNRPTLVTIAQHVENNGTVVVFEEGTVPFAVKRSFVVTAKKGQIRGEHAHRNCSQLLVAVSGQILVTVDDGAEEKEFLLRNLDHGLLVPPMVWSTQVYLSDESMLLVICDHLYKEDDYIRSYETFKKLSSQ